MRDKGFHVLQIFNLVRTHLVCCQVVCDWCYKVIRHSPSKGLAKLNFYEVVDNSVPLIPIE